MYACVITEICGTPVFTELDHPGENVAAIEWQMSATMIQRFQLRDRLLEDARL